MTKPNSIKASAGLMKIKNLMCVIALWLMCSQANAQCTPSPAFGGASNGAAGNIFITTAKFNTTTFYSGGTVGANPYTNLYNTVTGNVTAGSTYTFNMSSSAALSASFYTCFFAWIDWNNNGAFTDAGENVMAITVANGGSWNVTSPSFTVGAGLSGDVRMRIAVMGGGFGSIPAIAPCAGQSLYYGEFKDFKVTITPGVACSGTPASLVTAPTSTSICPTSATNIALTVDASGYTYQWQESNAIAGTYNNVTGGSGATSSTFTTPTGSLLPFTTTYYRCNVTCTASGQTTASQVSTVTLNSFLNCYCTPTFIAANGGTRGITQVILNGTPVINNTTTINNVSPYYTAYTGASPVANAGLTLSTAYTLQVKVGTQTGTTHRAGAWIDYNQNGVFETTEFVGAFAASVAANATGSIAFMVPGSALTGVTTMRVIGRFGTTNTIANNQACATFSGSAAAGGAGEVEDYRVVIGGGCAAPGTATLNAFTNVTTTTTDVNWTRGNGDAGVIVVARLSTSTNTLPLSGTNYTADPVFGNGTQIGTGNYVVYKGTGTSVTVTSLLPSTNYVYSVYEYNAAGTCFGAPVSGNQTTASCSPNIQPSGVTVTCFDYTTMTLSFVRGNGARAIVLAKAGSAVNANPAYNTTYTANPAFGSGSQIGTGNYVVYDGNDAGTVTVPLTGLTAGVTYHFALYEYNTPPNCYNVTSPALYSKATRSAGVYTSSTTVQNSSAVAIGTLANDIVKLTIIMGGGADQAAVINSITFTTAGSTNAATDITNAKIFYTGGTNTFSNATQFGSTFTSLAGNLTANGNFALLPGNNYFWIAYDVKSTATIGNVLDATVTSINITDNAGTSNQTPTVTAPGGSRLIQASVGGSCPIATPVAHGSAGGCQTSCCQGEQITSFTFGNTVSSLPCDASGNSGYNNLTGSTTFTVSEGTTYTMSEVDAQWLSVEYQWCVWIDWNGNSIFETTERYPSGTTNVITYGSSSQSVTVPIGVTTGNHSMRIWYQEFSHAPNACPYRTSNGPLTTSIGEILDVNVIVPNASGGAPGSGSGPVSCATDAPIVTTPVNYAYNAAASPLTATGTSLLWYTSASGGTGSATAPTPLTNASGTTTYYVSQTNTSGSPICEGPRTQIAVRVGAQTCGTAPSITFCPGNVAMNNDGGLCNAVLTYPAATASGDPSPTITYSQNSGTAFPVGTTTVTVTASNGILPNATCTFDVVVTDNEDPVPVLASLPDLTAECSITAIPPTATDNCVLTITGTTVNPTSYNTQGTFVITWSYNDLNGNIVPQTQNVIIDDVTNPTINNCPGNITTCNPVVTWTAPTASDNCGTASLSSNFNSGATFPLGITTVTYTADDGNGNTATCSFDVTIDSLSTDPTSITSDALFNEICNGGSTNLTVNGGSLGTAATWKWYSGSCNGLLVGTGSTINVSPTTNTNYFVRAEGTCNNTNCVQITIKVTTGAPVASVVVPPINNLPSEGCNGVTVSNINVPVVPLATYYIWDGPAGTTFNGGFNPYYSLVPNANITFGNVVPGASGYYIGVQAANACGTTLRKVQWVRGIVGAPPAVIPATSGLTTYCPNTSANFSCATGVGTTGYLWTITGDATVIPSGNNVIVNFGPAWTTGTLCVAAQTSCYTSSARCLALGSSNSIAYAPVGTFTACPGNTQTYSVPSSVNVASYSWSLPGNTSGSSITNSINVSFLTGFAGGNICVTGTSICGVVMQQKCKTITTGAATTPASITGFTTGVCGQTVQYNCPAQAGASFSWTLPAGATGTSTTNAISVTFPNGGFTTGSLSVSANNGCASSGIRSITVKGAPNTPGVITANPSLWCNNESGIELSSNISALTGIYNLNWNWIPASTANYVLGQNTNTILLDWNTGNASVNLTASNPCGSTTRTYSAVVTGCRTGANNVEPENVTKSALSIFPNPTTDKLNVEWISNSKEKVMLLLTDVSGKEILKSDIAAIEGVNNYQFDLNTVARGVYLLQFTSDAESVKSRIVVQ